jgi:transitional endoplasmic reticulum ATPase
MNDDDEMMEAAEDPVPVLTRAHFEEALASARTSVKESDLEHFRKFQQSQESNNKK